MSGVHGHVLGHLVKRTYDLVQDYYDGSPEPANTAQLQSEQAGPEMMRWPLLPVLITAIVILLIVSSIRYTLGEVMASLTMIESSSTTAIIDEKSPAYADEPDVSTEKELLLPAEAVADVEVTLVPNKPVTAQIRTTMRLLKQVGGFRAKWRGLGLSMLYHIWHAFTTGSISSVLRLNVLEQALVHIFVSVCLSRLHALWTHSMIAHPPSKPLWSRMVPRKQCAALLLPNFVLAVAQQATYIVPLAVAVAVGLPIFEPERVFNAAQHDGCGQLVSLAVRFLVITATELFVAFAILLPATVTLTRIEAVLLPESEDTIVTFDRQAILGDIDLTARGSSRLLFVSAWRSFDRASRWRLIKVYVKMILIQVGVVIAGIHLMAAEIYLIGEMLAQLFKSASAQLQLKSLEVLNRAQEQAQ